MNLEDAILEAVISLYLQLREAEDRSEALEETEANDKEAIGKKSKRIEDLERTVGEQTAIERMKTTSCMYTIHADVCTNSEL